MDNKLDMKKALLKDKLDLMKFYKKNKIIFAVLGMAFLALLLFNIWFNNYSSFKFFLTNILVITNISCIKIELDRMSKRMPELLKEINEIKGEIDSIEARDRAKEEILSNREKLEGNEDYSLNNEVSLVDYMNEYLANVDSFSDKEQALMELMDYVYHNLTRENYDGVTAYFASCFWKTIVDVENKDYVLKSLYPQFIASIISLGESTLGEEAMNFKYDSETGEYDEQAYLNFLVCYISNKSKIRERSIN